MINLTKLVHVLTVLLTTAACDPSTATAGAANASSATTTQAVSAKPAATKVTKIVFVGKEHACDCTRKTVEAGWAALQKALGTPPKLPVEKLQIDTQADKVAPYRTQKPMMALPAIYFVDGKNTVLELLQGEVSDTQISDVLKRL